MEQATSSAASTLLRTRMLIIRRIATAAIRVLASGVSLGQFNEL